MSSAGERSQVKVDMDLDSTFKTQLFVLHHSILPQANFTGTVEYLGRPEHRWNVGTMDPSATVTALGKETAPDGRIWTKYEAMVPLRHQAKHSLFYYIYD